MEHGFLRPQYHSLVLEQEEPQRLLDLLAQYRPVLIDKWIDHDQT